MTEQSDKARVPSFLTLIVIRDVIVILLLCVLGWKLLNADLRIDLSSFSFSELLALILSIFSVGLSVAFYFKATDTSNRFYENSYKFTKEMSEILGRIEAGFGEKLRHLDEGYTGIRDKFDRLPPYGAATQAEVKKEEEEIRKKEEEQRALLEDLARRARLAEGEKETIFDKLAQKSEELDQARMELRHLHASSHPSLADSEKLRFLFRYLAKMIREATPPDAEPNSLLTSPRRIFAKLKDELSREAVRDLKRFDLLDEEGNLTREAVMRLGLEMKRI